jgi:hypothetical protein
MREEIWGLGSQIEHPSVKDDALPVDLLTCEELATEKLAQTTVSAIEACDANDGVNDGIIDDPRTCTFSAKANVCGSPTAPSSGCLTSKEAEAIDMIWDGPRNPDGNKIWFGLDHGTNLGMGFALNSAMPFMLGITQFHWDEHDRNFDWSKVTIEDYAKVAQNGSRNIADVTDTSVISTPSSAMGGSY